MKTKLKDYYGNPLENGIYFNAEKSVGCFCKISLNKYGDNFSKTYPNGTISLSANPKEFAKKLIPFKCPKNLELMILSLEKEI